MNKYEKEIEEAAKILSGASNALASSGAGMSAESGIPTFRDPGGLWDRLDPMEVGTSTGLINTLVRNATKLIPLLFELLDVFERAEPNAGHVALYDLEQMGILTKVITQNVDSLHQEAGVSEVIEVHGNIFRMRCLSCGAKKQFKRKEFIRDFREKLINLKGFTFTSLTSLSPPCENCSFMMRPDVVMFGESVQQLPRASKAAKECDAMMVLGTSGVVYPAAYFPIEAKHNGAKIIVINPKENAFTEVFDVYIPMKTGEALPLIVEQIKKMAS